MKTCQIAPYGGESKWQRLGLKINPDIKWLIILANSGANYEKDFLKEATTLVEDLENPFPKDYLMIKGFERLLQCLIMLIDNSLFAIKYEKHKEELEEYRKVLRSILDIIPALYTNVSSRKNGNHIRLSRQRYVKVLDRVLDIKRKINEPLNKSHLIFTDKEEFDPVAFKERIKDRIVNQG